MTDRKKLLTALFPIALVLGLIVPTSLSGASAIMDLPGANSIVNSPVASSGAASAMTLSTAQGQVTPMVAACHHNTVGLKSDGTVVAAGDNLHGQCNVATWTGILQVAAGDSHTVGLKSDGTVVAVRLQVCFAGSEGWTDIAQVAAGGGHTVGLKSVRS